jgi:hypothetical protein
LTGSCGEVLAGCLLVDALVLGRELLEVCRVEVGVLLDSLRLFRRFESVLVGLDGGALDDVTEHLDEPTVCIPGETLVAGDVGESDNGLVVHPEVEDGVHHSRKRRGSAGANGNEERILGVTELLAHQGLETIKVLQDLLLEPLRILGIVVEELFTRFSRDREARRDGNTNA